VPDLLAQACEYEQTRGRSVHVVRSQCGTAIRTVTPNGEKFFIEIGYPTLVYSPWIHQLDVPASHESHCRGRGYVCLRDGGIDDLDLWQILWLIDAWAKGFTDYQRTGVFPASPREAFGAGPSRARQSSGFLDWLLG